MKRILHHLFFSFVISSFLFGFDLKGYIATTIFCIPISIIAGKCLKGC